MRFRVRFDFLRYSQFDWVSTLTHRVRLYHVDSEEQLEGEIQRELENDCQGYEREKTVTSIEKYEEGIL